MTLLWAVVQTWRDVRAASGRLDKRDRMARLFAGLEGRELRLAADYLSGDVGHEAPGAGWARVDGAFRGTTAATEATLTLGDVDAAVGELAAASGPGAIRLRLSILSRLLGAATELEREFLASLLLGELRQGALRALVLDALSRALAVDLAMLRRAVMFSGALGPVVEAVRGEGAAALARFRIAPLVAIEPMLASPAGDLAEALADMGGRAAAEWKLDGVRVQVHRSGDEVRVYTRALREVTGSAPEVAAVALALPSTSFILDGEAVAVRDDRPMPFQDIMSRFQREKEVGPTRLETMFFDLLYLDGEPWVDRPDRERRAALERLLPPERVIPRRVVESVAEMEAVLAEARREGHEGLVLKSLDAPYAAGRRGSNWRKVKPAHTLDLVILAAEWGHGRRQGLLSNLHLGARDAKEPGRFWMLGKTFKGLTDAMLRQLTDELPRIAVDMGQHVVRVRPEMVVEIAFDGIQRSTRYDSGLALRFARVKCFRPDKPAEQATTIDEVRGLA